MIQCDPKRTNVKMVLLDSWPEDDENIEPGFCISKYDNHLSFACPGCGRFGSILYGDPKPVISQSWKIESGSIEALNLTLSPSINCVGCCGWHGFLKNGIFVSC